MTKFQTAIMALIPLKGEVTIVDLACAHYGVSCPNKGQRAAVSQALNTLWRADRVTVSDDLDSDRWGFWRRVNQEAKMTDAAVDPRLARVRRILDRVGEYEAEAKSAKDNAQQETEMAEALRGIADNLIAEVLWSLKPDDVLAVEEFLGVWQGMDVYRMVITHFEGGTLDKDGRIDKHPAIHGMRLCPWQKAGEPVIEEFTREHVLQPNDPRVTWRAVLAEWTEC